ncbi:MAG: DUF3370 domain-containing protein [Synechococcaceae cyanobacterium]|nr:DUF3370 domain-containing protein [Synechococcaceae cyanobacterium]
MTAPQPSRHRQRRGATALAMALAGLMVPQAAPARPPGPASPTAAPAAPTPAPPLLRRQSVQALGGGLDGVPMLNDNNPELITAPGILFSSFDPSRGYQGRPLAVPSAHLNAPQRGPFGLFSHHVYAGRPESADSTLWLAVVAAPRGPAPVRLRLRAGATALSQSVDGKEPAAPFLPLPTLVPQGPSPLWSGPGSRVATELLGRDRSPALPEGWTLPPGQLTPLLVLPLPVRGLDPLLNGRNLQLLLDADGPVDVATLAAFGPGEAPPDPAVWSRLLDGPLSPKEHTPTPRGATGPIIYSRVSGVQIGSVWRGRLSDPGSAFLSTSRAPISWPIASLERGTLGTGQVQTAPLSAFYPGTAWAAHGNYGVTYDLTIPLRNDGPTPVQLALAVESPLKQDRPQGGLSFLPSPARAVMFRGTVEVSGLDGEGPQARPRGRQGFHLVLRNGQQGPRLGTITLAPGQQRQVGVRLIYPADATPPQVLSLLPLPAPASTDSPAARGGGVSPQAPGAPVKQSPQTVSPSP